MEIKLNVKAVKLDFHGPESPGQLKREQTF